jgi:hypothetical protein
MAKTTASAEGAIHCPGLTGSNRSIPDRPLIEFHQVLAPEVVLLLLQGACSILPGASRELESFTEANDPSP